MEIAAEPGVLLHSCRHYFIGVGRGQLRSRELPAPQLPVPYTVGLDAWGALKGTAGAASLGFPAGDFKPQFWLACHAQEIRGPWQGLKSPAREVLSFP